MRNQKLKTIEEIRARRSELVSGCWGRFLQLHPESAQGEESARDSQWFRDMECHLAYLCHAVAALRPSLFLEYLAWAKVHCAGRKRPEEELPAVLETLRLVLRESVEGETAAVAEEYLERGLRELPEFPATVDSHLVAGTPLAPLPARYLEALLHGQKHEARRIILEAVKSGASIQDIYHYVFEPCQYEIGRLWQLNQISVAQEHYCTAATQMIMAQLYPFIFGGKSIGHTAVVTCVEDELHEVGARMVADLLEMNGWDTFYLGANTPLSSVAQIVEDRRPQLLAISAAITLHLPRVKELIRAVRASASCCATKILVGGRAFRGEPDLWREVGADGYGADARQAVEVARQIVEGETPCRCTPPEAQSSH